MAEPHDGPPRPLCLGGRDGIGTGKQPSPAVEQNLQNPEVHRLMEGSSAAAVITGEESRWF